MIDTSPLGLSDAEAARRLQENGPNELPSAAARGLGHIVRETLREPMFLLLVGAAALYLTLGDLGEGLFLLIGAAASIALVIFQEARSEHALAALHELARPQARVIRDGRERRIAAHDLVPGDLLLVGEGERILADALLVGGDILSVDESTLTGESAPVAKRHAVSGEDFDAATEPGAAHSPCVFSGTLCVSGQGILRVRRTGIHSALGRIGASLATIEQEQTPLQRTAGRLVLLLGLFALVSCTLVVAAYGLLRNDWTAGALAGITLAIALIPEEFPMVLAVFMALGAWRLASRQVLVRRSAIIETLGAATVLCVDKTGTLTQNQMRVARLWTPGEDLAIAGDATPADAGNGPAARMLRYAALASALRPVDPMDKAIRGLAADVPPDAGVLERSWPLRPELLAVIQLWRGEGERRTAAAKGAPEAIFGLCGLGAAQVRELQPLLDAMGKQGLRVLGVASCEVDGTFPEQPQAALFRFEGLLGFIDPLRGEVPAAIAEAQAAGIEVVMITGDHPATAAAIAASAGIDISAGTLLGTQLASLTPDELAARLQQVRVFARVAPEQKLRLVKALRDNGEVVAMTGDGVNDAPALEAAHIGIAMGRRGTDVAREASDLVLLDDSFAAIVGGVRLGRRIFTNLRHALTYVVAIHVPVAGLALLPILLGLPPLLFPMHVVLLELAIDPICALVFEGEPSEADAMRKPPRARNEPLFGPRQLLLACLQGLGVLAGVFLLYLFLLQTQSEAVARGGAFTALVLCNLTLALTDTMASDGRWLAPHRRLFWSIAGILVVVLAGIHLLPPLAAIFRVAPLNPLTTLLALGVAVVMGTWPRAVAWLARIAPTQAPTDTIDGKRP
jgi:Ca2+-transporting ATPase